MKKLTEKQTLKLCKNKKFLSNKLRQKFCGCLCCETEGGEDLPIFSFVARIGSNSCGGRCVDTPFEEGGLNVLLYTTSPVYEFSPGIFFPLGNGALLFYDEELTNPVTEMFDYVSFTECRFGYVNPEGEFTYIICP
jgi:hypothetical protein